MARTHSWQRTAAYYREHGYTVVKTETTFRGRRHDLLGFIDGIALTLNQCVGLQACLGGDYAEHRRKICGDCSAAARQWLLAGNEIHLVCWRKVNGGKRGGRKLWKPKIDTITLDDLSS